MLNNDKKDKWNYVFNSIQKGFLNDLEKSFNKITSQAIDNCQKLPSTVEQLNCTKDIDDKMKNVLDKFEKDFISSLHKLEVCMQEAGNNKEYNYCIIKCRSEIQKEGLFLLDSLKLRIN